MDVKQENFHFLSFFICSKNVYLSGDFPHITLRGRYSFPCEARPEGVGSNGIKKLDYTAFLPLNDRQRPQHEYQSCSEPALQAPLPSGYRYKIGKTMKNINIVSRITTM